GVPATARIASTDGVPATARIASTDDVPATAQVCGADGAPVAAEAARVDAVLASRPGRAVVNAVAPTGSDRRRTGIAGTLTVPAQVPSAGGASVAAEFGSAGGVSAAAEITGVEGVPTAGSGGAVVNAVAPTGSGRRASGSARVLIVPALIVAAVVFMNAGFGGLGAVFDYPRVLSRPGAEVLASFRMHESAVVAWFSVLVVGALLFVPIVLGVGRRTDSPRMRWAVRIGVAAGVVQAIGLSRWPLLVPGLAAHAAAEVGSSTAVTEFEFWNRLLGSLLGETLGYLFTAAWTVLVVSVLRREGFPRWFAVLGAMSAALILFGVAAPWQVAGAQQANFAGYVLWSGWMLGLAVLWGRRRG
ncbi:DUF4386 family protein, partial [Nocardia sp. NPDC056611]|uniref:DUF4386 domain-containing protein n=1 Tax=Nocardia sp. NPDC056611 TaxID=3345877 RepID=UPI00366B2CD7